MFPLKKLHLKKINNRKTSSRHQIRIKGVREGVLILPQGKYSMIIETSAINFQLKSDDEQDVIIGMFENLLNAVSCPLQIIVRTREIDLDEYIASFQAKMQDEDNEIYREQISNYCEFVASLVKDNKVLARHFYIVISASQKDLPDFKAVKEQLNTNYDILAGHLETLGIESRPLTNLDTLDLFYSFYNPEMAKLQPITNQTFDLLDKAII